MDGVTRKPIYGGQPIFSTGRMHQFPALNSLIDMLQRQRIDIITANVEHGPGQIEINYAADIGVRSADKACGIPHALSAVSFAAILVVAPFVLWAPFVGASGGRFYCPRSPR